ncbi:uncharacterized protein LY79DRAFT_665888 [Colletotrichum navitas]|uniref:NADP-dependent oxidoreductase domain-containing protein n=1 Tax=Colletotrichum navitas TaxID=681940 RepID=A0AAD8Q9Z4_9PEZI|nr:uncharacterized protein LY79DRAFT_665888 [Colletotrichum navitas]KAK1598748.1 hypothetical protein LY79DRAFT_665888 [Colletotrichum navitas]
MPRVGLGVYQLRGETGTGTSTFFLVHRPVEGRRELWAALERLGSERAVGLSNFSVGALEETRAYAEGVDAVNQIEMHPWCQQWEPVEYCRARGIVRAGVQPARARSAYGGPGVDGRRGAGLTSVLRAGTTRLLWPDE